MSDRIEWTKSVTLKCALQVVEMDEDDDPTKYRDATPADLARAGYAPTAGGAAEWLDGACPLGWGVERMGAKYVAREFVKYHSGTELKPLGDDTSIADTPRAAREHMAKRKGWSPSSPVADRGEAVPVGYVSPGVVGWLRENRGGRGTCGASIALAEQDSDVVGACTVPVYLAPLASAERAEPSQEVRCLRDQIERQKAHIRNVEGASASQRDRADAAEKRIAELERDLAAANVARENSTSVAVAAERDLAAARDRVAELEDENRRQDADRMEALQQRDTARSSLTAAGEQPDPRDPPVEATPAPEQERTRVVKEAVRFIHGEAESYYHLRAAVGAYERALDGKVGG